jgi:pimeloyl-ACP methyl ester carboxylesterase
VVFVHGLAGDHTLWEAQLGHARLTRRALAYDLRGHGGSRAQEGDDFSISAHASDLAELADIARLDGFVLVGHSLGASIAGLYAAEHADRVAGLLLVDPSGDHSRLPRGEAAVILRQMTPEKYPGFMRRYFSQLLRGGAPAVRAHVLRIMRHAEREAVAGTLESSLGYNPLPALERYPGPKLSVVTEFNEGPTSLREILPDLPSRLIRGVSHWPMMDRPEEFNCLMDDFLRGISSPVVTR